MERRWAYGLALGLGYDALFIDSSTVFELGVMQRVRATARYQFAQMSLLHPFVAISAFGMIFGESFQAATVGGGFEFAVGAEIELSASYALQIAVPFMFFGNTEFTSTRDNVRRGEDGSISSAAGLTLGLYWTE